jgi:hypothetical protein
VLPLQYVNRALQGNSQEQQSLLRRLIRMLLNRVLPLDTAWVDLLSR